MIRKRSVIDDVKSGDVLKKIEPPEPTPPPAVPPSRNRLGPEFPPPEPSVVERPAASVSAPPVCVPAP